MGRFLGAEIVCQCESWQSLVHVSPSPREELGKAIAMDYTDIQVQHQGGSRLAPKFPLPGQRVSTQCALAVTTVIYAFHHKKLNF